MTDAEGEKLKSIKDLIKSVNSTNFTVTDGQLNLNDISISKITNLQDTLNGKVDRIYNEDGTEWTLLSPENQAKLAALDLNGENVEISGTVNADNVEGLASWITSHASTVKGLSEQNFTMQYLLKLAEIELIKQETNEAPILLLDDVLSELDDFRQTHLLNTIKGEVQTFVTTTSVDGINHETIKNAKMFHVKQGTIDNE